MKPFRYLLACFCISVVSGCSGYYQVIRETPPPPAFKNYGSIFVGWIDLDDTRWKKYGYETISQWQGTIGGANRMSLPQYFREFMPNRKITMAASARDINPRDADLFIKFSNVNYIASGESGARVGTAVVIGPGGAQENVTVYVNELDILAVTIEFIDVKENKSVYTSSVLINATSGSGFYGWTLEGRINNAFYNTVAYIDKTLKGKKK